MVVGADDFLQDVMIQANGFGFLLCTIMYSAIAVTNSGTRAGYKKLSYGTNNSTQRG
jgi:hypothetical protein